MAGMEQLEIHSKSYIVRWVKVEDGHTISWSLQPHKKSLNFGIVKHPGVGNSSTAAIPKPPSTPPVSTQESHAIQQPETSSDSSKRRPSSARHDSGTAQDLLKSKGFIPIHWHGKCEAEKVSMGTHAVLAGEGGMYGLVFDNTFSKTVSKTATFVLLTYLSNAPPNSTHHNLHGAPSAMSSTLNVGSKGQSPKLGATASESVDSLHSHLVGAPVSRSTSVSGRGDAESSHSTYHVGMLLKRRRKRGQGYARRYFSLDYVSCTLSYYYNRNSSALRGAIPLSLAAIAADARRREISIDSGAEIWHLRTSNAKDFDEWTKALELASNHARGTTAPVEPSTTHPKVRTSGLDNGKSQANPEEDREWGQVEALVSKIVGTRDAVRRLAKDTSQASKQPPGTFGPPSGSTVTEDKADYFGMGEKRPFWRRKASSSASRASERNSSPQLALPTPTTVTTITANGPVSPSAHRRTESRQEQTIHDHCTALLNDLDSVLSEFSILIANSKRRRTPNIKSAALSRRSMDSGSSDEFYDAEGGEQESSQLVIIQRQSGEETPESEGDDDFVSDSSSISSTDGNENVSPQQGAVSYFPAKPKSLTPLPISTTIKRRSNVPACTIPTPSLISFFRKNVGKDLSTVSMPVSANEPTSLLQRLAEGLEYASLLDTASQEAVPNQRLLYVAAFAVSYFSCNRSRERAIRKPFNPMLGETYELVRGDVESPGNFRFLAEKVSHRPVKMACQGDSPNWSFTHSPIPIQKFWGKSAELLTEGRLRIVLRLKDGIDECYSWNVATVFLRNMVMGEKYIEPVGTMTVLNETTGAKATIEFKVKGMFGGRSEDITVETYDPHGTHTGLGLVGTWTTSMRVIETGKAGAEIWKAGKLVDGSETRYGFTEFAATLNEITDLEKGKIPITDSRLRIDQKAVEDSNLEAAEAEKDRLEGAQRERRKEMESRGEQWKPRWFTKVEGGEQGEEVWKLKSGKEGYWEERAKGCWTGVEDVLCVAKD